MFRIRYYSEVIHPDHFKGAGFLGWMIRVLNGIRWWLETKVQKLVLRHLMKTGALPKERRFELSKVFDLDVAAEKLNKEQTSPLLSKVEAPPTPERTRAERYVDGRQTSALEVAAAIEQDLPIRPARIDDLIARYGAPDRSGQYGRGRKFTVGEDSFEPLEGE